ncbi:MAG: hypothetical protein HC841_08040 [Verrucomicrobiae bacterium]|nr:hypothetical protein [Verrucomicrobiae bacterium]
MPLLPSSRPTAGQFSLPIFVGKPDRQGMNWRLFQRAPASEGVLAPHPALVLTRNALAWSAALVGLFAILSEVIPLLYFHIHHPSLLPYHTLKVALSLVAAATILSLLMRMHPLKSWS